MLVYNCDVFSPTGGSLNVTNVVRHKLNQDMNEGLNINEECAIVVYGASRLGKTVLVQQILDAFGNELLSIKLTAGDIESTESITKSIARVLQIPNASLSEIREKAIELRPRQICVVIDDFHYIEDLTLLNSIFKLIKQLLGVVKFIMIAIPSPALKELFLFREFQGERLKRVKIMPWTVDELKEIGKRGFENLNLTVDDVRLPDIAQESLGSPHIMQTLCRNLCRYMNGRILNEEQAAVPRSINYAKVIETVAHYTATTNLLNANYDKLSSMEYSLYKSEYMTTERARVTFNQLILKAMAGEYIRADIPFDYPVAANAIKTRIENMLHRTEHSPRLLAVEVREALRYMVNQYELDRKARGDVFHDALVSFHNLDTTDESFSINDPYLLFYARHNSFK